MTELRIREAARALVVDDDDRVLLVRFEFPTRTVWAIPGGGIDPGESDHDALRRELAEEIGLVDADIGAHLWNRLHIIPFISGLYDGQRERAYLVRVPIGFEPQPQFSWEQLNAERVYELRWWTLPDLRAAVAAGDVFTAPSQLVSLVDDLFVNGPPASPPDVDP